MRKLLLAAVAGALALGLGAADAAETEAKPPHQKWSFDGAFGTFDRAAAQRGLQVYKEVCSACHAVEHLAFRHLGGGEPPKEGNEEHAAVVGIGWNEDQVKGFAAQYKVTDIGDDGQPAERTARPSDKFPRPFPNEKAARAANNGAYPPDLSLITKAREHGPDYVAAILTVYKDAPAGHEVPEGMYYNEYFPKNNIKMPPPLNPGGVAFADGT